MKMCGMGWVSRGRLGLAPKRDGPLDRHVLLMLAFGELLELGLSDHRRKIRLHPTCHLSPVFGTPRFCQAETPRAECSGGQAIEVEYVPARTLAGLVVRGTEAVERAVGDDLGISETRASDGFSKRINKMACRRQQDGRDH